MCVVQMCIPFEASGACGLLTLCRRLSLLKPDACSWSLQIVMMGWPGAIVQATEGWTNQSGLCGLLSCCVLLCESRVAWLLTASLMCPPIGPKGTCTQIGLHLYAYAQGMSLYTYSAQTQLRWCALLLASRPMLTRHVQQHTIRVCHLWHPKPSWMFPSLLSLSLVLFSQGILNKYALQTLLKPVVAIFNPPRYAFQAKNQRHSLRRCQNMNAALQVME